MKTTLFFLFGFLSFAQAQSISEYYGHIAGAPGTEGANHRGYIVVTSTNPIDQSPSGVNATWTFDQLTPLGASVYDNAAPTGAETSGYPGTTMVTTNVNSVGIVPTTSKAYFVMNQAFTGATAGAVGLELHYTDNATIGTFPLPFNYTNTDATSGTYTYTTYSGTFSGNIVSSVDAYGTLTTNDYGFGPNEIDVTRLKIVQTLNLNYPPFTNVGTVIITNYHYYHGNESFPFFTSATTAANIPLLSIDQTVTVLEAAGPVLLGTPGFNHANAFSIAPNPVGNILSVQAHDNANIRSIKITDTNGRIIATPSGLNAVDVSHLSKGIYFAQIESDTGSVFKKFIKD
jgi:hypothetical protein